MSRVYSRMRVGDVVELVESGVFIECEKGDGAEVLARLVVPEEITIKYHKRERDGEAVSGENGRCDRV